MIIKMEHCPLCNYRFSTPTLSFPIDIDRDYHLDWFYCYCYLAFYRLYKKDTLIQCCVIGKYSEDDFYEGALDISEILLHEYREFRLKEYEKLEKIASIDFGINA
jgi:hypothetical protein